MIKILSNGILGLVRHFGKETTLYSLSKFFGHNFQFFLFVHQVYQLRKSLVSVEFSWNLIERDCSIKTRLHSPNMGAFTRGDIVMPRTNKWHLVRDAFRSDFLEHAVRDMNVSPTLKVNWKNFYSCKYCSPGRFWDLVNGHLKMIIYTYTYEERAGELMLKRTEMRMVMWMCGTSLREKKSSAEG